MANLVSVTFCSRRTMLEFLIRKYHWFTNLSVHFIITITQIIVLSRCRNVLMLVGNPLVKGEVCAQGGGGLAVSVLLILRDNRISHYQH